MYTEVGVCRDAIKRVPQTPRFFERRGLFERLALCQTGPASGADYSQVIYPDKTSVL